MASGGFFRKLRILFLLFVLFIVAMDAYLTKVRTTDWDHPLRIVIYPINGDNSEVSAHYIDGLDNEVFMPIQDYMVEEAGEYKLPLKKPVLVALGPQISELPPKPPVDRNMLKTMWWSLRLRYWVFSVDTYDGPPANIRVFVVYHDPEATRRLAHSLGLEKGLIGVVNAYAHKKHEGKNNVVIAHEFLHTVGASDKYDINSGAPIHPDGFVDPEQKPLYPQLYAEIMAGVIPKSPTDWVMPKKLSQTLIGYKTAQEINWIQQP